MNVAKNKKAKFDHPIIEKVRHKKGGIIYKNRMYVTVRRPCNLAIQDESGDIYSLTCLRPGRNYVDYNSKKPTIVSISIK